MSSGEGGAVSGVRIGAEDSGHQHVYDCRRRGFCKNAALSQLAEQPQGRRLVLISDRCTRPAKEFALAPLTTFA